MKEKRTFTYEVVGGPNDGGIVELTDSRPEVRLLKPARPLLAPDDPIPLTVDPDEISTLYTTRHIHDHYGHLATVLAPADMSDEEVLRRTYHNRRAHDDQRRRTLVRRQAENALRKRMEGGER